jgi:hypothetical protein
MKKLVIVVLLLNGLFLALNAQYFKTSFKYSAGMLQFYLKPTGALNTAIESFQFDITYPLGANINFGSAVSNTAQFPGLNIVPGNLFTLNGEWVKRWEHSGIIPTQFFAQNVEYLVFSVPISGSGTYSLSFKSDYPNFDPVFTVNDDMGNPLWDDIFPYDVYYPNQLQSGDIVYMILNVTLPIELRHFSARVEKSGINLVWDSEYEKNFLGFEIQRSLDGKDFLKLNFLNGKDENSKNHYEYFDSNVSPNINYYYRLKMLDKDGSVKYSETISAELYEIGDAFELLQNPVASNLRIRLNLSKGEYIKANIFSANGNLIYVKEAFLELGTSNFDIFIGGIPNGDYVLNIEIDKKSYSKNFIVIN